MVIAIKALMNLLSNNYSTFPASREKFGIVHSAFCNDVLQNTFSFMNV